MRRPIQRIAWCQTESQKEQGILLAACGPHLFTAALKDGSRLSRWSSESPTTGDDEPPTKKRKTGEEVPVPRANIALLHLTADNRHAIAVTGEDKSVHVFHITLDGQLQHLSRRCMPKRPSALALTPDDSTILVADKFGDVYALPLVLDAAQEAAFLAEQDAKNQAQTKPYKPAATALTVHSQRNLKALEQQLKQQAEPVKTNAKTKEPLRFSHQLLLGHVSVLTDVLSVRVPWGEKHRDYILTADRDEHIRVSRGVPQAHVIEGFCLGHASFVSKLCMITQDVLVSGDGDGCLYVWDWLHGKLRRKIDLTQRLPGKDEVDTGTHGRTPISGLWTYPADGEAALLLVACEGYDTLWTIAVEDLLQANAEPRPKSIDVGGNILDLAVCSDKVIVARDTYHIPRTMDRPRQEGAAENITRLCVLEYSHDSGSFVGGISEGAHSTGDLLSQLDAALETDIDSTWSASSLYGLHTLRKRGGEEAHEDPA